MGDSLSPSTGLSFLAMMDDGGNDAYDLLLLKWYHVARWCTVAAVKFPVIHAICRTVKAYADVTFVAASMLCWNDIYVNMLMESWWFWVSQINKNMFEIFLNILF